MLPLLLRGDKLSLLERNLSAGITASQVPDPLYPLSRLGDTRPSQLFIFPLRLEDEYYHIDVNQYRDALGIVIGGFENWTAGIPDGHTVNVSGTGAITEEIASPIFAGSSSMQMENGASGTVEVLASITVLSGDEVELRYASQTSVASSPTTMEVFNPYTGKWLTTSGNWSSRRQNAIESVLTVMDEATLGFTVEGFSQSRSHEVALEIRYHMDSAAATTTHHWDEVRWIPGVDFASIHAHNMSAGIIPRLVSSDENIAAVLVDRGRGFDNSTQIEKAADFTALVDGRKGALSIHFRMDGGDGVTQVLFSNGDATTRRFQLSRLNTNVIQLQAFDSGGVSRLIIESVGTVTADGNIHHALFSWDLDGVADDQLLILDGVRDDVPSFSVADIDYTTGSWVIGGYDDATLDFFGVASELWFDPTNNIDFKIAANVILFRTAAGKAAMLGSNGDLVNGTSPILYWRGDSDFTNSGTGGDFDSIVGGPLVDTFTLEAEFTKQDISFYTKLATTKFRQFWKFHMRGTNAVNPIETGLWNLAQSITPPWSPRLQGNQEALRFPQTRAVVEASGEQWAIKKAKHPRRSARMSFNLKSTSQASFRDELLARTFGAAAPFVLVEDQGKPKVVHGRSDPDSEFVRRSVESEIVELIVEESSNGVGLP